MKGGGEEMPEFNAILLEGKFTLQDLDKTKRFDSVDAEKVIVKPENKPQCRVVDVLRPAVGQEIVFSMHHVPISMNPFLWGGGNCIWQSEGWCPAKHHLDPLYFFNMSESGVLEEVDGVWQLRTFMGKVEEIPFEVMIGHFGRIAAATVIDTEKMKEELMTCSPETLAAMGLSAAEAREMLEKMSKG